MELELVLETEHSVIQALRMVCEHLYPTGIDDPLGLASVLHMHIVDTQAIWPGSCRLIALGEPCPLAPQVQREALRIVREALTNAAEHAQATETRVDVAPIQPARAGFVPVAEGFSPAGGCATSH